MAEVPLVLRGTFDDTKLNSGLTRLRTNLLSIKGLAGGVLGGLVTGAAITGLFKLGQSVDDLGDSLQSLEGIAGKAGIGIAKAMRLAADGDLTFRQSVQLTTQALGKLPFLESQQGITDLTLLARKLAPILGTDVAGAVELLSDQFSSGKCKELQKIVP